MADDLLLLENFPIIFALILVFFSLFFLIWHKFARKSSQHILLTGLSAAGKTAIFNRLIYNKSTATYTSCTENCGKFDLNGREFSLVDLPGYHSLRDKYFEKYKSECRSLVFVVDSCSLPETLRDVASCLFAMLLDAKIVQKKPRILILCTKQDRVKSALTSQMIEKMLENEINILRSSSYQAKQLNNESDAADMETQKLLRKLGDPSRPFEFAQLYTKIEFTHAYAVSENGGSDLASLVTWITENYN